MVEELRAVGMTIAEIAEGAHVDDRQVYRWLEGDRPKGLTAVRVYTLHVNHCPEGQWRAGHSQILEKA